MKVEKILIATGIYPPSVGGPATYSKLLHDELPKRGIEVVVVTFDDVRHLPKILRHIVFFFKVMRASRGVDIIYAQDPVSVGFPSVLAAKILRKRVWLRVAGDYAWEQSRQRFGVIDNIDDFQKKQYGFRVEMLRFLQIHVVGWADLVITPSKYFKKLVGTWYPRKNHVEHIYNGIELPKDLSSYSESRKSLKISTESKVVMSAGRLVPWKGFNVLMEVVGELVSQYPHIKLVILGDGPDRMALENKIIERSLEEHVSLVGSVNRDVMFEYLSASDVFVLDTSFESFSFQVVEAMHTGIPIVTTRVGSLPELITHKKEGLLIEVDDKKQMKKNIQDIFERGIDIKKMSEDARDKAQTFSIQNTLDALVEKMQI